MNGGGMLTSLFAERSRSRFGGTPQPNHIAVAERERYASPETAPLGRPVEVRAKDNFGPRVIPFACIRTPSGWIVAKSGKPVDPGITITGWRHRDFAR